MDDLHFSSVIFIHNVFSFTKQLFVISQKKSYIDWRQLSVCNVWHKTGQPSTFSARILLIIQYYSYTLLSL